MVQEWEGVMDRLAGPRGNRTKPEAVAQAIVEAIEKGDKLRYPVGNDAQMVLTALKAMDHEAFIAAMRQQLGVTW
jgi:hypothetical protein